MRVTYTVTTDVGQSDHFVIFGRMKGIQTGLDFGIKLCFVEVVLAEDLLRRDFTSSSHKCCRNN